MFACGEAGFVPILAHPKGTWASLDPRRVEDFPIILDHLSLALVGRPYRLGPLGEGEDSSHPLYRLDVFDCTTYLETIMANAYCFRDRRSNCLETQMRKIRYGGNRVSFAERNHIPELDWLPHNQARGYLADLSTKIFPGAWNEAESTIDRSAWLAQKGIAEKSNAVTVKLPYLPVSFFFRKTELTPPAKEYLDKKLAAARKDIQQRRIEGVDEKLLEREKFRADLEYLRATNEPISDRIAAIPSGTVLNLVRAPIKVHAKALLTPLISHQGLVIQTDHGPRLRHTAPNVGHSMDQSLADYLLRYVRSSNYRGIALFRLLPAR
jgi:hypothetical protein